MKLDEAEVALFDAILVGEAAARGDDGNDEQLAEDAAKRALVFIAVRRKTIPSKSEAS